MDEALEANRVLWDAWTPVNAESDFYDVASFRSGKRAIRLSDYEMDEVGPVESKNHSDVEPGEVELRYPYWTHEEPLIFETHGSYANRNAYQKALPEHAWDHSLGEIVTALIDAGLHIDFLHEFDFVDWGMDLLVEGEDGKWRLPPDAGGELPLMFSIRASKPPAI